MTSNTTDPRPAATEAARSYVMEFSEPTLENFLIRNDRDGLFRFIGSAVSEHQRRLNAAAPPSGQVCVSEQTRQIALAVLTERANDYTDAQEMSPHYGTIGATGTPWDSAIAELSEGAAPPSGQVCVDESVSLRVPDARAIRAMLQRITKGPDAKVASYYVEDLTERIEALKGADR